MATDNFEAWVLDFGVKRLAKKLDTHHKTIHTWLRKAADPRINQIRKIRKLSKGKISYEMIIDRRPIIKTFRAS